MQVFHKFVDVSTVVDFMLNIASLATLFAWFTDHLNTVGGFIVMISVATLNFAKTYNEIKKSKKPKNKTEKTGGNEKDP